MIGGARPPSPLGPPARRCPRLRPGRPDPQGRARRVTRTASGAEGPAPNTAAPLVSVLLPARDAQATLGEALASVARQTETRWECVVVDDASPDATGAIAAGFGERDSRVRVVAGGGEGLVAALQLGLGHCRAPLIARMDADDWRDPERLAAQIRALDDAPGLAGVGCHVRSLPQPGEDSGRADYIRWLSSIRAPEDVRREAFVECPIAHPTWLLRSEVLREHPYRAGDFPEDYDLLLRVLASGGELGVVPRPLLAWRDSPGRLSRTHPAYREDAFTTCKAMHLATGCLANDERYVLWGYGATGRRLRRALGDRGRWPSHIVELHPGRLGQRIHGAPVIAPEALQGLRGARVVTSVAGARARGEIRAALNAMGFHELHDFVCAA